MFGPKTDDMQNLFSRMSWRPEFVASSVMKVDQYTSITMPITNSGLHQTKRGIALVYVQNRIKQRKRKRICSSEKLFTLTFKNFRRTVRDILDY